MSRYLVLLGLSIFLLGSGSYSSIYSQQQDQPPQAQPPQEQTPQAQPQQEQAPQQSPPTHRFSAGSGCSRKNPNAEAGTELNGIEPNTVSCSCQKKCVNGQTEEDLSRDEKGLYICGNACHKDRCFCPNPCKT